MNFTTPVFTNTTTGAAVDGNSAGEVPVGPQTITGINWQPGADLWIRWLDPRTSGNNHGAGIDNVTFTAIPEPGSAALFTSVAILSSLRRRLI